MGSIRYAFFRAFKSLHVNSTALNQELITLMSWATGYSAPRRVTSTPANYHPVLTACSNMRLAQTSKQPFGSKVCKAAKGHGPHWFWLARRRWSLCHWLDERWPSPHSRARTTVLLVYTVMSTSYLQLPDKCFEVHGCVQAIRLWQQMWRFHRGVCLRWQRRRRRNLTLIINVAHVQAVSYILNNYSYLTFRKFSHGNHPGTISLS